PAPPLDPGRAAREGSRFLRHDEGSVDLVSWVGQQPWHPSPRPVDDLSPSDGFESAVDLRRQRRRTLPGRIATKRIVMVAHNYMCEVRVSSLPQMAGSSFGAAVFS